MSAAAPSRDGRARRHQAVELLIPRGRPDHLGPVHILQLVAVELAVLAAVAAYAYGALVGTAAAIAAGAVAGVTLARWRGRWLIERRVMTWRYRRRRRGLARPADAATLSLLRRLSPQLTVTNVSVPGGPEVGVAKDDAGWFAAATIAAGVVGEAGGVPLDLIVTSIADAEQAGAVVQVVIEAMPATTPESLNPAELSYHDLATTVGSEQLLANSTSWVVVRIDARGLAEAIGDHDADVSSASAVVASLLRRLVTSLRQAGVSARLLDADGLVAALKRSCDLDASPGPDGAVSPVGLHERWSRWQSSRLAHRTFWIRRWPPVRQVPAMFDALFAASGTTTTVSLVLEPDPDSGLVDLTALVRVSAPPAQLDRAAKAVLRASRRAKAHLFALDGEHAPAAYASAPSGGGAR